MNTEENNHLSPSQQRAKDALAGLDTPKADPAFRARLKQDFVDGELQSRLPAAPLRPWYFRVAVPLAAAAVLVLMVGLLNRGPAWTLVEGEGNATIDGVSVSLSDPDAVRALLHGGSKVEIAEDSRAYFKQGGIVMAELHGGTTVSLPNAPGRWFNPRMEGTIEAGSVGWITGPRFPGSHLVLNTPESIIEVTGTCFKLMCTPEGTCLCVLEGEVRAECRKGNIDMVSGGHRKTMFSDGSKSDLGDILESSHTDLVGLAAMAEKEMGK
jgi:ferric-dicitrate binding protein FerR (iron transport regulator)